jgi:hypothetical protein
MLRLRTFGGLALEDEVGPRTGAAAQRRRLALLAILPAGGPAATSRDRITLLLRSDGDADHAPQALAQLVGPEALSPREVVRVFEEETGRRFDLQFVPDTVLAAQRDAATDSLQQAFAALMLAYAAGDPIPTEPVRRRSAVRLMAVRDYARQTAETYPAQAAIARDRGSQPTRADA